MLNKRHTAIDLFSGCGGLSLGLRYAGFQVVAAVESDTLACDTYELNHPGTVLLRKDIRKIRPSYLLKQLNLKPGELTLLAGCPPCQGFSTLRTLNGSVNVEEPMNDLLFQFLKFVRAFVPKSILMENVPGLAVDARLEKFKREIRKLGYQSNVEVLNAADYGTPQRRRRMVLIATFGQQPRFGEIPKYRKTVAWALRRLERPENSNDVLHNYEIRRSEEVQKLIEKIPLNGGSRTDLPKKYQLECHKNCDGFKDIYGRMSWDKPSPTITGGCINPSKGRFLHPEQHRAITLREAALLQGFPKNYKFDMSRGRYLAAKMIGNAFPPRFAQLHATALLNAITSETGT
ncbi:DNA cytosine methyltransferase [Desulfonatronum sp. SC1]|uniref:DNA cytosine methyltransferase n=1 Tax=Desulfonatronum sp. SC1 TaxID=2109626 RepID=UPI000D2F6C32|nr:DNA cytosine methyltransferase [Desulfonatronum sp. SC1]PTN38967.1 DNA (cytosine-5-)-methyltransferase [Desulfonatronum sp. SC1]